MSEDTITLISRDAKNKVVCHKYMEEYFLKEGYVSSKKIHINLLYKLFSLTILRKIRTFFTLFLRCKFFFKDCKHSEFVIFDSEHTICLEEILANKNYIIVSTRIEQINEIYVSPKIVFYIIKNLFKRSLKQNYLTVLIKTIAPKIVITHISNSEDFHIVSRILHNEIKFIAIQTYTPSAYEYMKGKKNFFIPKLFCFSKYDELFYKKKKVNIEAFEAIGSTQSSLCCEYVKSEKLKIDPNKYDICLIAEAVTSTDEYIVSHVKNLADSIGLVAKFTYKLCKKHNLNIVFAGRVAKNEGDHDIETYFYKHYLKNYDFKIFQSPNKREKKYPTYVNVMQSKLTIALHSTILREAICFGKKILSFNPTGHPAIKFPGPDIKFPEESICTLNVPSYELFETRVLKLLSMTNEEYFNQLGKEKSFIMEPTTEAANIVRKRLKEMVEQNIYNNVK